MKFDIRKANTADAERLTEISSQKIIISNTLQLPFPVKESWERSLSNAADQAHLVIMMDGLVIGYGSVQRAMQRPARSHVAVMFLFIDEAHHGFGAGSSLLSAMIDYARSWLQFRRLELTVYTENLAAIALYEKFGFRREGVMSRYAFRDGAYQDAISMSLLVDPAEGAAPVT